MGNKRERERKFDHKRDNVQHKEREKERYHKKRNKGVQPLKRYMIMM